MSKKISPQKSKSERLPNLSLIEKFKKKYQHDAFCKGDFRVTVLDRIVEESEAIGRAKGEAIGIAKGRVKGKAEMIIRILSFRFEVPPKSLQKKIKSIQGIAKLNELGDLALACVSLSEFAAALKYLN
ncbi:MAG: hypothetical protein LBL39_00135 [Planctomycetaceae bacterium]|nr:hypothetical protein [Planctomycetaceae bacterium]